VGWGKDYLVCPCEDKREVAEMTMKREPRWWKERDSVFLLKGKVAWGQRGRGPGKNGFPPRGGRVPPKTGVSKTRK